MRTPSGNQAFDRAERLVDRRRLVIGLSAAVVIALVAALLGVLRGGDSSKSVSATASAQAAPVTTGVPVVNPEALGPAPLPPDTTTTTPALVLGTSFSRPTTTVRAPGAPKPAAAPAKPAPPAPAPAPAPKPTGSTTPFCHNSYDPACGPFRWEPAPAQNQLR